MIWSFYNHIIPSKKYGYFLYNALSGTLLCLDENELNEMLILKENPDKYLEYENGDFLLESKILVESDVDNLAYHTNEVLRRRYDTSVMNLTIAVTRSCNFSCIYCYEIERDCIHMTEDVEDSIVDFVNSNKSLRALNVVWYGGEPLMNFESIKRLSKKFIHLNLEYSAEIVTNGYLLTEAICKEFNSLAISKVQITLDGFEETHNKRRPLKSGDRSYKQVFDNVECLLNNCKDISIHVRSNIDRDNMEEYGDFYNFITSYFTDNRITPYPGFVTDLLDSGCSAADKNITEHQAKVNYLVSNYKNKGVVTNFLPSIQLQTCIANNISCFLIDPIGDVYKCWIAMSDTKYRIGNLKNAANFDDNMIARFMCGADYLFDPICRECSILPICDGGCPMLRIVETYERKQIDKCYSYKKESLEKYIETYYEAQLAEESITQMLNS